MVQTRFLKSFELFKLKISSFFQKTYYLVVPNTECLTYPLNGTLQLPCVPSTFESTFPSLSHVFKLQVESSTVGTKKCVDRDSDIQWEKSAGSRKPHVGSEPVGGQQSRVPSDVFHQREALFSSVRILLLRTERTRRRLVVPESRVRMRNRKRFTQFTVAKSYQPDKVHK